jgi:hypothetical protein
LIDIRRIGDVNNLFAISFQGLREAQRPRATIGATIPEGQRNNTLTSLAGTMRRRGMGAEEIEAALLVTNNKRCDPPLATDEVKKIASSVCRYKPARGAAFL